MNAASSPPDSIDPQAAREFATHVVRRLQQAGHEAYWAGGCVRDWLLGRLPKDYDVATSAHPDQVRGLFGRRQTIPLGAAFGIITVLGPRRAGQVEVATFRRDSPYSDGRHPDSVEFSSAKEDALRRDFTVNGLFFDPLTEQVLDFVDGELDLQRRVLRAIGDPHQRFSEDWLRMLRAARFAAAYELTPDPDTARAVASHAEKISGISAERISAEMLKMLVDSHRRRAVELLQQWGLLTHVLPPAAKVIGTPAWKATLATLEQLETPDQATAIAALVEAMVPPDTPRRFTQQLARQWRLANQVKLELTWLLESLPRLDDLTRSPWSKIQPLVIHPHFESLLRLTRARWKVSGRETATLKELAERRKLPLSQLDPPPLLTGDDLRSWGWLPGPHFRTILAEVRNAQLDQEITSPQEAEQLARSLYQQLTTNESASDG